MKLKWGSRTFVIQVVGLLLLWCLAIYTIYQIRLMSFQTINFPVAKVDYHLIIYQPNEQTTADFSYVYKNMDNLPIDHWNKNQEKLSTKNSCASFPNPFSVKFHQIYWQSLYATGTTGRILNAYLDTREDNPDKATVRILAMIESNNPALSLYCQLWFEEQTEPVALKSHKNTNLWLDKNDEARPLLINCIIPPDYNSHNLVAVSLVENPCDNAINVMKVKHNRSEKKKEFGVCIKGLDMPQKDFSDRLIEWVELLNVVGAEDLFFYDLGLHPNVKRVLNYYEKKGNVHVTELKLAESPYELTKMQRELIPYTDCFYKHMYEFDYIVILDIDEMLLPLNKNSWKDLISNSSKDQNAFYNTKSLYFVDTNKNNSISDLSILQNIYRQNNATEVFVQTFFKTTKILTLHNDLPVNCLKDCKSQNIEADQAQLQHYREDCSLEVKKNCVDFKNGAVVDRHILDFKDVLTERVSATKKYLASSTKWTK